MHLVVNRANLERTLKCTNFSSKFGKSRYAQMCSQNLFLNEPLVY